MGQNGKNGQQANLRDTLLADMENAEQQIEAFNSGILNHKHIFPGAAAALMVLLYLGMIERRVQIYTWAAIGLVILGLIGLTFWKRQQADKLNARLETAQLAFKDYERTRRKKRRKKK